MQIEKKFEDDADYYKGPMVGYTTKEMTEIIGSAVLDVLAENDLQIVWNKINDV